MGHGTWDVGGDRPFPSPMSQFLCPAQAKEGQTRMSDELVTMVGVVPAAF